MVICASPYEWELKKEEAEKVGALQEGEMYLEPLKRKMESKELVAKRIHRNNNFF